jgi:hypothetical protein
VPIDLSRVGVSVDPHGNIVPLQDSPNDPWAASGVRPFYNHIETSTTMPYAYPNPYGGGLPYGGYPAFGVPGISYGGYPSYGYPRYGFPGYGYPGYGYPGYGFGNRPFGGGFSPYPSPRNSFLGNALLGAALFGGAALGNTGLGGYPGYGNVYAPGYRPFGYGGYANPGFGAYPGYGNAYAPGPFGIGYATTGNSATFISNDPVTGAPIPQGQQGNSQTNNFSSAGTVTPGFFSPLTGGYVPGPWIAPTTSYSQNSMWKAFNLGF